MGQIPLPSIRVAYCFFIQTTTHKLLWSSAQIGHRFLVAFHLRNLISVFYILLVTCEIICAFFLHKMHISKGILLFQTYIKKKNYFLLFPVRTIQYNPILSTIQVKFFWLFDYFSPNLCLLLRLNLRIDENHNLSV